MSIGHQRRAKAIAALRRQPLETLLCINAFCINPLQSRPAHQG